MELPKGSKRRVKERLKHYVKDPYACDLIGELFTFLKYSRVWPVDNVCFIKKTLQNINGQLDSIFGHFFDTCMKNIL